MLYEVICGVANSGKTGLLLQRAATQSHISPIIIISEELNVDDILDRLVPMMEEEKDTFEIGIHRVDIGVPFNADNGLKNVIQRAIDELPEATNMYIDLVSSSPAVLSQILEIVGHRHVTVTNNIYRPVTKINMNSMVV